jgi:hypothetical protein
MTAIAVASPAMSSASGRQDHREHRRKPRCPSQRRQRRAVPATGLQYDLAASAPSGVRSLPELLDELVELGRAAWRIDQRERAVRAEIEALRAIVENPPCQD